MTAETTQAMHDQGGNHDEKANYVSQCPDSLACHRVKRTSSRCDSQQWNGLTFHR
jgi:hypothetical protein